MRDKLSRSASPDDVCALMLFPLFFDGRAIIQPLYNGIIMPLVMMARGAEGELGKRPRGCPEYITSVWSSEKLIGGNVDKLPRSG